MSASAIYTTSQASTSSTTFRADIQGLRAIAVLAVILDHLFGWPSGGFVGVDVFFVISGFLITGLMLREHERTGRISWSGFYRRRVRRIVPAATACLVAVVGASYFIYRTTRFQSVLSDAFWSFVFASNWHFAITGTDYLDANGPISPLQHFWSLAVEEQFYIVWPLLLLVMFGAASRQRRMNASCVLAAVMTAVITASFLWAVRNTATSPTWAYFSTFTRAWELAVGALLAVAITRLARIPVAARPVMSWLGVAIIVASLFLITTTSAIPGPWAALPVAGAALVIAAGAGGRPRGVIALTNPVSVYLGKISYSLYLWHFPVIILLAAVIPAGTATYYLVAIAGMAILSVASFHLIEDPVRRSSWLEPRRTGRRSRSFLASPRAGYGAIAVLTAGVLVLVVLAMQARPAHVGDSAATVAAAPVAAVVTQQDTSSLTGKINAALDANAWPTLDPTFDQVIAARFPGNDGAGCAPVDPNGRNCDYTTADPAKLAIVAGDSVAVAWLPGIRAALEPKGWTVETVTYPGCPFVDATIQGADPERAAECDPHRALATDAIIKAKPALLITSNLPGYRFAVQPAGTGRVQLWQQSLRAQYEKVRASVGRFVILGSPPPGKDPAQCVTATASPSSCESTVTDDARTYATAEKQVAADSGATFVDTVSWFCAPQRGCPIFVGSLPVRRDLNHITPAFSVSLAPLLAAAIGA